MNESIPIVIQCIAILVVLGLWAWSVTWAMGDAERRGKPGCLVGAFVGLFSWPVSLLMWIVFRPEREQWR